MPIPKSAVDAYMNAMRGTEFPERPRNLFRVSSFPYCPVVDFTQDRSDAACGWSKSFYTGIGTAVHEAIQTHLPLADGEFTPIGLWRCGSGHVTVEPGPTPAKCGFCRSTAFSYVEIEFDWKGLSGHLDYLTRHASGEYLAWEFKTTGTSSLTANYGYGLPRPQHVIQIETYCALLGLQWDIPVAQCAVVYFSRESPDKHKIIMRSVDPQARAHVRAAVKGRRAVLAAREKPGKKTIRRIVELKPCRHKADYYARMDHHFFQSDCPHFADGRCLSGDSDFIKHLRGTYGETSKAAKADKDTDA